MMNTLCFNTNKNKKLLLTQILIYNFMPCLALRCHHDKKKGNVLLLPRANSVLLSLCFPLR